MFFRLYRKLNWDADTECAENADFSLLISENQRFSASKMGSSLITDKVYFIEPESYFLATYSVQGNMITVPNDLKDEPKDIAL
jgi:hypothetical protein